MKDYTYQNTLVSKKQLKDILAWSFTKYGSVQASFLADELKYLGFKYSVISIILKTILLAYAIFLMPVVLALLYSVQGGDDQTTSKEPTGKTVIPF